MQVCSSPIRVTFEVYSIRAFCFFAGTWSGAYRAGLEIYRQSGVLGLFQGHSATLLRIFPYAAIKYMFYDQIHLVSMFCSFLSPTLTTKWL